MLAQYWPFAVNPTQENVAFCNVYVAHDDVGLTLVLRRAPNVNYQPTVEQFANVGYNIVTIEYCN